MIIKELKTRREYIKTLLDLRRAGYEWELKTPCIEIYSKGAEKVKLVLLSGVKDWNI